MSDLSWGCGDGEGVELNVKFELKFKNKGSLIFKLHPNYYNESVLVLKEA